MPTLLLLLALSGASTAPVTPAALRARYGDIGLLTADVLQVKTGRYWARPFESRIRLRYTPERVTWETLTPVASTVLIEGDRLVIQRASGERRELDAATADPRFSALLRFLRALLALDLPAIERDFIIDYRPDELVATPRPGSEVSLFTGLRLRFGPDLEILSLELETPREKTLLTFEHVRHESARRRPVPAP